MIRLESRSLVDTDHLGSGNPLDKLHPRNVLIFENVTALARRVSVDAPGEGRKLSGTETVRVPVSFPDLGRKLSRPGIIPVGNCARHSSTRDGWFVRGLIATLSILPVPRRARSGAGRK